MQILKQLNSKLIFLFLLSIVLSIYLTAQSAFALATLKLYDGSTTILVEDGSSKDTNPATGAITYNDTYGDFSFASVLVSTGITYPVAGTIDYPIVHLDSVTVSGAGTLDVWFSEVGFGPTGFAPFQSDIGGIAGDSVSGWTYVDGGNTLFGTSTSLSTFGPYTGSFSGTDTTFFNPTEPYSLTTLATITHTSAGQVTSLNLQAAVVPEPVSSTLFIIGGVTLGFRRFRKKFKK
jgi:hypothetical protein